MAIAKRKSQPTKRAARPAAKATKPSSNGMLPKVAPPRTKAELQRQAERVTEHLRQDYPEVTCALAHRTPYELLIATILSAQCTDARVNIVTPDLFRRWPDAESMAKAPIAAIEKVIQSTGFFRNKAKNIKAASQAIVDDHDGELPQELDALVALPGVGRKTANVVLGTAFGIATGVVVDTHVTRLSNRLGLTKHKDAVKIEQDLMKLLPENEWVDFSHRMIHHGRRICDARKPKCLECSMKSFCPRIGVTKFHDSKG
jgi:endonuclease-3